MPLPTFSNLRYRATASYSSSIRNYTLVNITGSGVLVALTGLTRDTSSVQIVIDGQIIGILHTTPSQTISYSLDMHSGIPLHIPFSSSLLVYSWNTSTKVHYRLT